MRQHASVERRDTGLLVARPPLASRGRALAPELALVGRVTPGAESEREADAAPRSGPRLDLSHVRIHDDAHAARSAERLGARAFTHGNHVGFAAGAYRPDTADGRKLLHHELTHVAQQQHTGPRIQCKPDFSKPQPLDPADADSDKVKVADQKELDRARAIFQRISSTYGIKFKSKDIAAKYATDTDKKIQQNPALQLSLHRSATSTWTLDQLEKLEESMTDFSSVIVPPSPTDTNRVGPETIGRVDKHPDDGMMNTTTVTKGETTGRKQVALFDGMDAHTIRHELGHAVFGSLEAQFAQLPFWVAGGASGAGATVEQPPTAYGATKVGEDVADSVAAYVEDRRAISRGDPPPWNFQTKFPQRYALVDAAWTTAWKVKKSIQSVRAGPSPKP